MKYMGTIVLIIIIFTVGGFQLEDAKGKDYYRTFTIIDATENSLTLQDNDGNIIEVDKDAGEYKAGYKVRYDSIRKRLRAYRWQNYTVTAIDKSSITLQHETGDIISVSGNYTQKYQIGDAVRYDSVDGKMQPDEDSTQWNQYTVIAASRDQIVIRSNLGEEIVLNMDNNKLADYRRVYIPQYKVGDLVRYDVKNNKLKKEVRRTYDWQEYEIKEISEQEMVLVNKANEILVIENAYGAKFRAGDQVKYDRLNKLLKKSR